MAKLRSDRLFVGLACRALRRAGRMAKVGNLPWCTFRCDVRMGGSQREAENMGAERIGIFSMPMDHK